MLGQPWQLAQRAATQRSPARANVKTGRDPPSSCAYPTSCCIPLRVIHRHIPQTVTARSSSDIASGERSQLPSLQPVRSVRSYVRITAQIAIDICAVRYVSPVLSSPVLWTPNPSRQIANAPGRKKAQTPQVRCFTRPRAATVSGRGCKARHTPSPHWHEEKKSNGDLHARYGYVSSRLCPLLSYCKLRCCLSLFI